MLRTCRKMKERRYTFEFTYLVIPNYNDKEEELREFSKWVVDMDSSIPVHFSRFFPAHLMMDVPPTEIQTLEKVYEIAKENGIEHVYLGNISGHKAENTFCPECGELLIERMGYGIKKRILKAKCPKCGRSVNIRL